MASQRNIVAKKISTAWQSMLAAYLRDAKSAAKQSKRKWKAAIARRGSNLFVSVAKANNAVWGGVIWRNSYHNQAKQLNISMWRSAHQWKYAENIKRLLARASEAAGNGAGKLAKAGAENGVSRKGAIWLRHAGERISWAAGERQIMWRVINWYKESNNRIEISEENRNIIWSWNNIMHNELIYAISMISI